MSSYVTSYLTVVSAFGRHCGHTTQLKQLVLISLCKFFVCCFCFPPLFTLGLYTYSIKVASEKNDAWSVFHSLRCIIVASLVNYVLATSLETQKANASNASMLCQQNVKTMYFKTLNPSLFNLRLCFDVRFFSVAICKCCKFSTSLLGSRTWEFWIVLKNQIQGVCWKTINNLTLRVYLFLRQFF